MCTNYQVHLNLLSHQVDNWSSYHNVTVVTRARWIIDVSTQVLWSWLKEWLALYQTDWWTDRQTDRQPTRLTCNTQCSLSTFGSVIIALTIQLTAINSFVGLSNWIDSQSELTATVYQQNVPILPRNYEVGTVFPTHTLKWSKQRKDEWGEKELKIVLTYIEGSWWRRNPALHFCLISCFSIESAACIRDGDCISR